MTKIISICSNKGGVGKTTSSQNIAVALASLGNKVAVVDLDAQANLSHTFLTPSGLDITEESDEYVDLATAIEEGEVLTLDDFAETSIPNLWILPNDNDVNVNLFKGEDQINGLFLIKNILPTDIFDYIVIDTPPALEMPTFNAFVASDYVLIPVKHDRFSADGLVQILNSVESAKKINKDIEIAGIFATFTESNTNIAKAMDDALKRKYGDMYLDSQIRKNIKFSEAQLENTTIFDIGDQRGIDDYTNLTKEIIKIVN